MTMTYIKSSTNTLQSALQSALNAQSQSTTGGTLTAGSILGGVTQPATFKVHTTISSLDGAKVTIPLGSCGSMLEITAQSDGVLREMAVRDASGSTSGTMTCIGSSPQSVPGDPGDPVVAVARAGGRVVLGHGGSGRGMNGAVSMSPTQARSLVEKLLDALGEITDEATE